MPSIMRLRIGQTKPTPTKPELKPPEKSEPKKKETARKPRPKRQMRKAYKKRSYWYAVDNVLFTAANIREFKDKLKDNGLSFDQVISIQGIERRRKTTETLG